MDRVGTRKWSDYVFGDDLDLIPSETEDMEGATGDATYDDEGIDNEESVEMIYGSECIIDPADKHKKMWVPRCPEKMRPALKMMFDSLDDGEAFYRAYGKHCGFDTKRSTSKTFPRSNVVASRYLRCTRHGHKNVGSSKGIRKTTSNRVGCGALLRLKYAGNNRYVVSKFCDAHTHDLMPHNARHLLKVNRKMHNGHKKFMLSCAKANLGPHGSHNLFKQILGGLCNIGITTRDFRNCKRDLMANIADADAQMVIDKLRKKNEICSEFFFEYAVNDTGELTRIFWCDPIARRNYAAFGQVVSFDATYGTNRYCMVFAPFTGLDNHRKSVTFGCGLLVKEDIESYTWLFQQFKKAMTMDPIVFVTDQDCAMKVAVESVFDNTRHRLCIWNIMDKVSTKVGGSKMNEPGFRKPMGQLVWRDQLTTSEFEDGWSEFTSKYNLVDNPWQKDMFNLRSFRIPSFFRDVVLGGLIKTTSVSESQNSFFGKYSSKSYSLVELMVYFDSALEKQRHNQFRNDIDFDTRAHDLKTPLGIEQHASSTYTLSVFAQVQVEIEDACYYFCVIIESPGDTFVEYTIKEGLDDKFDVRYNLRDGFTNCTCMMFNKIGLPCCHVFYAWRAYGCNVIPDSMILPRWRKGASRSINAKDLHEVFKQSAQMERRESIKSEVWATIYEVIGIAQDEEKKLEMVLSDLNDLKGKLEDKDDGVVIGNRARSDMEEFAGVSIPEEVVVLPPRKAKNKGSGHGGRTKAGNGGRIKGGKETTIAEKDKNETKFKRKCKKCGQYKGHDSRNCTEAPSK